MQKCIFYDIFSSVLNCVYFCSSINSNKLNTPSKMQPKMLWYIFIISLIVRIHLTGIKFRVENRNIYLGQTLGSDYLSPIRVNLWFYKCSRLNVIASSLYRLKWIVERDMAMVFFLQSLVSVTVYNRLIH